MTKSIPSSGAGAVRIILKNKDALSNVTNLKKLCKYVIDQVNA